MDTKGEGLEGGMNWEIGIKLYILQIYIYIIYMYKTDSENLLYSTGNSTQCSVVT